MKHPSSNAFLLLTSLVLLEQFQLSQSWSIGSRARGKSQTPTPLDLSRRSVATTALASMCSALLLLPLAPSHAKAKCTDIESCREIGERKEAQALAARPIVRLEDSLQYRVLNPGLGEEQVTSNSKVQIIFSISQANGDYMFSRGFGFNKIDIGNGQKASDFGTDSLMVDMADDKNAKVIPIGISKAMMGMKRGERRRIECPPELGFETSDWNPKPTNFRGKQQIKDYRALLEGRGSVPPFPAPTIWDVEVIGIRS